MKHGLIEQVCLAAAYRANLLVGAWASGVKGHGEGFCTEVQDSESVFGCGEHEFGVRSNGAAVGATTDDQFRRKASFLRREEL